MAVFKEEAARFDEHLNDPKFKVMMVYADWCGPCQMMHPILDEVAKEVEHDIVKFNIDQVQEKAREHEVRAFPTFLFVKDGKVFAKQEGGAPKEPMVAKIQEMAGK